MSTNRLLIGITGGTGAGKTSLVSHLSNRFTPKNITVVTQDNYYKPINHQPIDSNGVENFDTLQSIDPDKMKSDLVTLLEGGSFQQQVYNFNNPVEDPQWIEITPSPVIIVEGLFALSYQKIFNLTDVSIFIDTTEDLMLKRRIARDFEERGYDSEDVTYRFHNHFLPAYKEHVLPLKDKTTHVISNTGNFDEAVSALESQIITEINFLN